VIPLEMKAGEPIDDEKLDPCLKAPPYARSYSRK
jgi:hypothetical protein